MNDNSISMKLTTICIFNPFTFISTLSNITKCAHLEVYFKMGISEYILHEFIYVHIVHLINACPLNVYFWELL